MKSVVISIAGQSARLHSWTDDCDQLMDRYLQLLPEQKQKREYVTTQLRAFNYSNFFRSIGIDVRMDIANPSEHARLTVWSQRLKQLRNDVTDSDVDNFVAEMQIPYRTVQVNAIKKLLRSHFSILAAGCGAGKTLTNLSVIQYRKKKNGKVLSVIVAPSACAGEYQKELTRFRGYFDLTMNDACVTGLANAKQRILNNESDIILVSVDSVAQLSNELTTLMQGFDGETILIIEEGHSIKNLASRRSRGVQTIAPLFDQVIVSTATLLPLGPKDLRGYIGLVGLPQPEDAYASGIPARDFDLLKGVTFVTDEDDVPFAPLVTQDVEYSDLEDLKMKTQDEVMAEIKAEHKVVIFTSTNEALKSAHTLFPGIGRTVLSGSFFVNDPADEVLLRGRSKDQQRKAIDDFNNDPNCRILIANYRVGSTGLNLQYSGARMALFYEITNSGADFFQSKYRIRRPNVFPAGDFRYVYALPLDPDKRRTVNRQFIKLADQKATLKQIKMLSGGAV